VNPLHFAFVACNRNAARFRDDPSFVYRCENMAAALRADGHQVSLFHLTKLPLNKRFDAVFFHRPKQTIRLKLVIFCLKFYRQCVLVADFDDLIFDQAFAEFSPGVINSLVPLKTTRRDFRAHRRTLDNFNLITVSTEPLVDIVETSFPSANVELLPNTVHLTWRNTELAVQQPQKEFVITYFPGTRSHDRDFASIAEPLTLFLKRHPQVRLHITGPLHFDLPARAGQVYHREKVSFDVYPECFRDTWVNLAPLESTPFNRCKSALKVLEAGCWGVPTICSPLPDAERFNAAGALKADTSAEWFQQLESLLDPDYYRIVTENLRERVLNVADTAVFSSRLVHAVLVTREEMR
jgi:glycosyltransferase involved in cell wall biosynthesis